jgi:predicted alpha/beta hydrolase family esterase
MGVFSIRFIDIVCYYAKVSIKDYKIIFIHGYTASSSQNWYPRIAPLLTNVGVEFVVPDMPGDTHPHAQAWLDIIQREVQKSTKPIILVGHSLGTRAALLYLDQYKQPIAGALLIAPFANWTANAERRSGLAYPDFFEHSLDITEIRKLCPNFVIIHSIDDDHIDYAQGKEIAEQLGANFITVDGRKHMSAPENANIIFEVLRDHVLL